MDSLYYSAPRPFNKYPRGYRPVHDTDFTASRLRPSSSWSSFPQTTGDQRSATLPHFPSTCVSPNHNIDYYSQETRSRKPLRSESSSTVFDNYGGLPNFSPRELSPLSPLSTGSEYCNNPTMPVHRSVQSPVAHVQAPITQGYDNVPRPPLYDASSTSQKENAFLRNLQKQKEEAAMTNNMSASWYGADHSNEYNQRQNEWSQQQQQHPRRLAKTQSDLSFDTLSNTHYDPNAQSFVNNNQRLDGFFRNRVIEPNWMTDPPPPKSFREDYIIRNNPVSSSLTSDFERFRLDPTVREPTRASSVVHSQEPQQTNFRNYHRDSYPVSSPPTTMQYNSFPRSSHVQQMKSPLQSPPVVAYAQHNPFSFPNPTSQVNFNDHQEAPHDFYNQNYIPDKPKDANVYQNVPPNSVVYREKERPSSQYFESNRNSAIYNEPIPLSHNRVLHIHPVANQVPYQQLNDQPTYHQNSTPHQMNQSQRTRIQSPLREFARLTSPLREMPAEQVQPDERIFSPVESKVYNRMGPTVINGFTSNRHTYNSHTDDYNARNRRDSSQPPVAVIEPNINVHMPSDPIPYNKPHFGHHNHQRDNQHQSFQRKPHDTSSHYNPTFSPTNRPSSVFSPNFENDNDSDLDIEEMARKALPKYLRDSERAGRNSNYYGDNLHGILIKNPSIHRSSSKKVVFIDQEKGPAAASGEVPPHIRAYDDALESAISRWSELTNQIGGDVVAVKPKVLSLFDTLRNFLWTAAGSAEVSAADLAKKMEPIVAHVTDVNNFKDKLVRSPQSNHLSAICEALPAFGWVDKKTPAPYIKDFVEAAMFYINRILKEYKETDPKHAEWAKSWKEIFEEMQKFVRQVHTTGVVWNSAPGNVPSDTGASVAAPTAAPAPKGPGGPPPPPPPPIPSDLFNMPPAPASSGKDDKASRDALFAALNKGEAITSGLKKVTADMQTHKNPGLRGNTAAPPTSAAAAASKAPAQPVKKPAKMELQDGKQWNVEYFVNDKNIVIDVTDRKQTIYIFRCEGSVIQVKGKANSITLDGCKKTSVVFDALVAQCETINCQSVQIQTLGELPTLSIQKTDGCQVYLSKAAQGAEIVTSKSSEMNILVQTTDEGDYTEFPVPEQFKTTYVQGKGLVTTVSDIC